MDWARDNGGSGGGSLPYSGQEKARERVKGKCWSLALILILIALIEKLRRRECVSSLRIRGLHGKKIIYSFDLTKDHREEDVGARAEN